MKAPQSLIGTQIFWWHVFWYSHQYPNSTLREKCPYSWDFGSVFYRIWTRTTLKVDTFHVVVNAPINRFLTNVLISYHLKTAENLWFWGVFSVYEMWTLARNGLTLFYPVKYMKLQICPLQQVTYEVFSNFKSYFVKTELFLKQDLNFSFTMLWLEEPHNPFEKDTFYGVTTQKASGTATHIFFTE